MAKIASRYLPTTFESKWAEKWISDHTFKAEIDPKNEKKYILDMFPYPSGEGLHVGHFKGYDATDIISRYFRLKGFEVLHPMGWDAFGLPAENYAIKMGIHPRLTTEKNVANIKKQMQMVGLSYDWEREINTTDPEYFKWTQWIFIKMFEKGLAYEAELPINFCPSCKTGLANEEVVSGACERCGTKVERRVIRQWVLKITEYADRLLDDLKDLDWPEAIKEMQMNWIGRSVGVTAKFKIEGKPGTIDIFTTRIDTIFGVTAVVLAPEHEKVVDLTTPEHEQEVADYIAKTQNKSDLERTALEKDKTGVFTGSYAINPVNGEKVPVWISDYVLGFYGTGAVMFVPAHDQRDFEFANKFNLPIKQVIKPVEGEMDTKKAFEEYGILINSNDFDGLTSEEAKKSIANYLKEHQLGEETVRYHLRDWLFSRQRYWGEPIPILHCEKCGLVPVPEEELPLTLPEVERYEPTGTGESPLARIEEWVNTTCPKCKGKAKRETNTMPQWAGSCWYYLRFCDPKNNLSLVGEDAEKYFMPVDWYVGGAEHAVLHLLYARFWHKFLYDIGVVKTKEPFMKLRNVGLVLAEDGRKMSKSLGNVVTPDEIVKEYGADSLRVYEAFMGPFDNAIAWDPSSINGVYRFLSRVWEVIEKENANQPDEEVEKALNRLIGKVGNDIEAMKFNTAVASMMEFINLIYHKNLTLDQKKRCLIVLSPFAPFMTEELWQKVNGLESMVNSQNETSINHEPQTINYSIHQQSWPAFDEKYLVEDLAAIVIQINGKVRDQIMIPIDMVNQEKDIENQALLRPRVQNYVSDKKIIKIIHVPGKIVNFVL